MSSSESEGVGGAGSSTAKASLCFPFEVIWQHKESKLTLWMRWPNSAAWSLAASPCLRTQFPQTVAATALFWAVKMKVTHARWGDWGKSVYLPQFALMRNFPHFTSTPLTIYIMTLTRSHVIMTSSDSNEGLFRFKILNGYCTVNTKTVWKFGKSPKPAKIMKRNGMEGLTLNAGELYNKNDLCYLYLLLSLVLRFLADVAWLTPVFLEMWGGGDTLLVIAIFSQTKRGINEKE